MTKTDNQQCGAITEHWARGDLFKLDIPADGSALISGGGEFLTKAFHAFGVLPANNKVSRMIRAEEFFGGGTGSKLVLTVEYEAPAPDLPNKLFVKFSRNFDDELCDSARFMMISEVNVAVLSRDPDFPVAVAKCLFADVELQSATGLIITEQIEYGANGLEALYPKCMDYAVPEPLEHYKTIIKTLARLAGTHKRGALPASFDEKFPYDPKQSSAFLAIRATAEKLIDRANRMFDFAERYPQLFPESLQIKSPQFKKLRQQFISDIPVLVAAEAKIKKVITGNPDFFAFCHWNANIDNCWFWRDEAGTLQCGLMDWAMAGQLSVAQAVLGAISGAEQSIWNDHLEEILTVFIEEYAAHGGPRLAIDELRLHILLIQAVSAVSYSMSAPLAVTREITDLDKVKSYRDECFQQHENARIQLHMMTRLLNVWQTRGIGELIRGLVD